MIPLPKKKKLEKFEDHRTISLIIIIENIKKDNSQKNRSKNKCQSRGRPI